MMAPVKSLRGGWLAIRVQDIPIIEGEKMAASNPTTPHVVNPNAQDGPYRRIDITSSLYSHYVTAENKYIHMCIVFIFKTRPAKRLAFLLHL
ncbi:hypothetical protein DPMN_006819 [Dreissena polymorpha]|uniref:Uncharacterized protein n=1 Tax=Dreissena polymorpha TaxID=45954 RepID=A0A9D4MSK4_DREPO|nr:hypothetical protein DPMN_006819 [Dreissena polymorpha]